MKLLESAAVSKLIDSIKGRGAKLDADIHTAAVSSMVIAAKHGDVTLMQRLIASLPASARKNAVIAWAIHFGPFAADETGKSVVYDKSKVEAAKAEDNIEAAMTTAPWEFKPEEAFKEFDLAAQVAKLLAKAEKAANDPRNKVDGELLRKLATLATA